MPLGLHARDAVNPTNSWALTRPRKAEPIETNRPETHIQYEQDALRTKLSQLKSRAACQLNDLVNSPPEH